MKSHAVLLIVSSACFVAPAAARADDTDEARRMAEQMVKSDTIEFLTDRKFEVDSDAVEGEAEAVDPREHVKVEIKDLILVPGHVTLTAKIDARIHFEGTLKLDDKELDVEATGTISTEADFEADYRFEDGSLWVDGRMTDAEFEAKILELDPDELPGGKRTAEQLVVKELERRKDELMREVNGWIRDQRR